MNFKNKASRQDHLLKQSIEMGFGEATVWPEENTIPIRTSENGPFTGGRLKATPAIDPEDCITLVQGLVRASVAPTTSNSIGTVGEFFADVDYFYICTATDTWIRIATTSW